MVFLEKGRKYKFSCKVAIGQSGQGRKINIFFCDKINNKKTSWYSENLSNIKTMIVLHAQLTGFRVYIT